MKASEDLHQLIASLTSTEKRYCRLHISRGSGRNAVHCLKLFDVIAALPEYDEARVRKKLNGEPFLEHLAVTKNYLYSIVLRALRAFNSRKFVEFQAHELYENAVVLLDKGLMAQSEKQITRAIKFVRKHDLFESELEIRRLEKDLRFHRFTSERIDYDLNALTGEFRDTLVRSRNFSEHFALHDQLYQMAIRIGVPRNEDDWKAYNDFMQQPLLCSEEEALSNLAKLLFYSTHRLYCEITGDFEQGYHHTLRLIELSEILAAIGQPNQVRHGGILCSHIDICIRLGKLDEAELTYGKLLEIPQPAPMAQAALQRMALEIRMRLLVAREQFAAAAAMGPELEEFFCRHKGVGMRQARLLLPLIAALASFYIGRYNDAARMLQPLIDEPDPGFRPDLQSLARLLRLVVHYELGNMELLPYLWRSTYHSFSRRNNLHPLERCVLDFIRRLPGIYTGHDLRRAFLEFKQELETLSDDPFQAQMIMVSSILPWLERKVEMAGSGYR